MPQVKLIKPGKTYPAGRVLNLTGGEIDALQRTRKGSQEEEKQPRIRRRRTMATKIKMVSDWKNRKADEVWSAPDGTAKNLIDAKMAIPSSNRSPRK